MMESENTEINARKDDETGSPSETNEHDYAHAVATNFTSIESTVDGVLTVQGDFTEPEQSTQGQPNLSVELPEPAVGAEVDCSGGNETGDTQKAATSELVVAPSSGTSRGGRRRSTRPEDKNCCCCKTEFERQGRSFNRRAVYTFTTPETVHWAFPDSIVHEKSFLCETCAQVIRSKCKRKQSGKRSLWLKPPAVKQVRVQGLQEKSINICLVLVTFGNHVCFDQKMSHSSG